MRVKRENEDGLMCRVCLFVSAVVLLAGISSCTATQPYNAGSDHLCVYLHTRRLPLVEARTIINDSGERSLLLYGFVATDYGKQDAEVKARDFVEDPDITIVNRIVVRPELLTMGAPQNPAPGAAGTVSAADNAPEYDQNQATPHQPTQKTPIAAQPKGRDVLLLQQPVDRARVAMQMACNVTDSHHF